VTPGPARPAMTCFFGGADYDTMVGSAASDTVFGVNGNDNVLGGKGNDELSGKPGLTTCLAATTTITFLRARATIHRPGTMRFRVTTLSKELRAPTC